MSLRMLRAVLGKELVDHLRDRRSLASALIFPLLGPVLFGVMFTTIASWNRADQPLQLAVVGRQNAPTLMRFLERAGAELEDAPADYEAQLAKGKLDCVVVVPESYGADFSAGRSARVELVVDNSRQSAHASVTRARKLLQGFSAMIGAERLIARGVSPEIAAAVHVEEIDVATPEKNAARALEMIPLFIVLAAFLGGMHVAIDATAGERERGSLEPLLVNPVRRGALVAGKWLATVLLADIAVLVCIAAFRVVVYQVPLHDLGVKARMEWGEVAAIAAAILPLTFFASALQMLIATYARSFKEAQTYLQVLQLVPTIPGIVMTLNPIQEKTWMMLVPVLGQNLLIDDIMRDAVGGLAPFVLAFAGCAAGAAICLAATTRLLGQERIIFGR